MNKEDFYKGQFFKQLEEDIREIKSEIAELRKDSLEIKEKLWYVYGFAGAVGMLSSFIWYWLKTKILKS